MGRRPYQWPASRIDAGVMKCLHQHATRTGKPITSTLREAALAYLANASPDAVPDLEPHDAPPPRSRTDDGGP